MKLSIKLANGTEQIVDLGPQGLKLAAQPGATYHLIDDRTQKTPTTAKVKRVQGDLEIDGGAGDAAHVQITGFFDDCTPSDRCWATFDAPIDSSAGMPAAAGGAGTPPVANGMVVITQDGQSLAALQGGHVGGMVDGQMLSFAEASRDIDAATWGTFAGVFAGSAGLVGTGGGGVAAATTATVATSAVALGSTDADVKHALTIKGTVAAGPVMTGTVEVSAYDGDGNLLGKGLVNSDKGTYEIDIADKGGYTGPILLVARDANSTGGNYVDEATGKLTDLGLSLGAVGFAASPTDLMVINITPITQIATLQMGIDVNAANASFVLPSDAAIIAAVNASVGAFFGVADILGAVVTINDADFRASSADAQAYGVALARLSKLDETLGSSGATIEWLVRQLSLSGSEMTSTDPTLNLLDTSLTIPRLADLAAAVARGDVTAITHVNLTNVASVQLVFAMPVNAQVGDIVHVTLAGTVATVSADAYVVTAADLANGYASIPVTPLQLATAGTGTIVPTAIVTDAAGSNASPVITAQSFLSDVSPPDPVVTVAGVHGHVVTADDPVVAIKVVYDDAHAGDTVQLWLDGAALGQAHVVTAAEAAAGAVELSVARASLGADGAKVIAVTVQDIGGNTGTASPVTLALDTTVPAPTLAIKAGQDATLSAGEPSVDFEVRYADMAVGDTVRLNVAGTPAGVMHRVDSADVASGVITVTLAKEALGDPGTKDVSVVVIDTAGNAGAGPQVAIVVAPPAAPTSNPSPPVVVPVDPVPPMTGPLPDAPRPVVAIKSGEDATLNAARTGVDLQVTYAASAGDRVQLLLEGVALGAPHVVTAAEAAAGAIDIRVAATSLGADGLKHVTTQVTDRYGQSGASATLALTLDTAAPTPSISVRAGDTNHLGLGDADVHLQVMFPGMREGDVVRLQIAGTALGEPHVVTTADLLAGSVAFDVSRASLGADGLKLVSAAATDAAGNVGISAPLPLSVDTLASSPTISLAAGESTHIGAAQSAVHITVDDASWSVGDVLVLRADGVLLVPVYFVTAADVASGSVVFTVPRASLGADGTRTVIATVIDGSGNSGNSPALPLTLDTVAPSAVTLVVAAGDDAVLNAFETDVQLQLGYVGMAAGDVVALNIDGSPLGTSHVVTAAEAAAGTLTLDVSKTSLGADGAKNVTAIVTDAAGNAGASPALTLTVSTHGPSSVSLAVAAGEDNYLNAAETGLHLNIGYAGMAAGDVIALNLDGAALGTSHVVTAAEAAAGTVVLDVSKVSLGGDGIRNVTATVTDAAGNTGSSAVLPITLDSIAPSPTLVVRPGEDTHLGLGETHVHLQVAFAGMMEGDTVQLQLAGARLGSPHVVTAADLHAGNVVFDVARTDLGADGLKLITAVATDMAGNIGNSTQLSLVVDTQAAAPTLSLGAGEGPNIGASQSTIHISVSYPTLAAGDVIQLRADGSPLGAAYTVNAFDVSAGSVTFGIARGALGADGVKVVTADVTDVANNTGSSPALPLTLDSVAPSSVSLVVAAGEDAYLAASESDVHLNVGYAGMAAGDVVQLNLGGSVLGTAHVVTAAEATAGTVVLDVSKASLGGDGVKNVTATVTDAAGNAGTSLVLALTLDSIAPSSVSLAVAAGEDGYLNANETDVHLNLGYAGMSAGDVVQLNLGGSVLGTAHVVTAAEATAGTVVLDVSKSSLGGDGVKNVTATVTDAAGNAGTSPVLALTLDGVAPSSVSLAVAAGEDGYLNANETDVHLNLGYAGMVAGDVVQLNLGNGALGAPHVVTAAEVAAGTVVLDVSKSSLGGDGVKNVTATVTDMAGNAGSSGAIALIVDTAAPAPTLTTAPGENAVVNASENQLDVVVADASLQAGEIIRLTLDGVALGPSHTVTQAEAAAGSFGFTIAKTDLGADGTKQLVAVATDLAGNVGSSAALAVVLDTSLPQVAFSNGSVSSLSGAGAGSIGAGHAGVALVDGASTIVDGGTVAIGRVSVALAGFVDGAAEQVTFGGQAFAADGSNAPATVSVAGMSWSVAYASASHSYTFTAIGAPATAAQTAALMQASYNDNASVVTDGQRVLTYVLTDADGNAGNSATASVLVSTTPPTIAPSITSLGTDTGTAGDFITTAASQTVFGSFTGQARSGDTIQVSTDGTTWTDATVYAAGSWYVDGITLLAGSHDLYVRAIDMQGNARTPTTHAYTLDAALIATTATIGQVVDDVSSNGSTTGALTSGISTDDTTPTVSGTLGANLASGQVVAIYDTVDNVATRLGEAVVNGTNWSFTSGSLAAGLHSLTAVVEKPASGASSAASSAFVIDEQSITFGVYDHVGSVQGLLMQGGITDDTLPTVSGTIGAAALGSGEVVAVYDGTTRLGNATLNGTSFSFTPGTPLGNGSHTLVAMIEDDSTGTSSNGRVIGTPVQFTIDTSTVAPTQTTSIGLVTENTSTNGSITGTVADGTSTDGTAPTLSGMLSATLGSNQDLAIFDTVGGVSTRLGTASVAGVGWTFTSPTLAVGAHSLTAVVENTASGLQGAVSPAFTLIEQSVQLTGLYDDAGITMGFVLNNGITDDAMPTLSGTLGTSTLGAGEALVVYDGTTRLGNATVNGTHWTFTPTMQLPDGAHTFRAMVEDDATGTSTNGRAVSSTMVVTIVTSTQAPVESVSTIVATEATTTHGSVSGSFASGTSTDGTTPTFSGTVNAALGLGEALAVYDTTGGVTTRLGFATLNGTAWSFTSPALAVGSHSISAQVENVVFGSSGVSSSPFIVIEQQLNVTGLVDDAGAVQGQVAAGGVTDDATPTLTGTLGTALGAGEAVVVYDGNTRLGSATLAGTNWNFTSATLADGAHNLRAMVEDAAAGTSATGRVVSATTAFTLNTSVVVPTQSATIASVTESNNANGSLTGAFASGTSTDGTTPTLNGFISATLGVGQVLAIYDGATRLGAATVAGTSWSYTTPALALGSNSLTAVVENPATGAHGTASSAFVVIEQSLAIDSLLGLTGAVNVLVGGIATVVVPTAPQISGTLGSAILGANEVVALYDGGTKLGNAVLNGNAWGFSTANAGLVNGFHTVTAMIQDGNTVDPSTGRVVAQSTSFTINASLLVPTATPQITYGIESTATNGSKIGGFASSESIDSQTPTIGGTVNSTLDSSQVLAVYDGTTRLGNAVVVGQSWSFATPTLAFGAHALTAQVENVSTGSHGTASSAYVVKVQSLSPITVTDDIGAIRGTVANGGVTDDIFPTFSGTLGAAGIIDLSLETVSIYDTYNGVRIKIGDAFVSGTTWTFTPTSLNLLFGMRDGQHSVNAVIEPLLSQTTADDRVVSASSTFTVDTASTPTTVATIGSVTDAQSAGGSVSGNLGNGSTIDDTKPVFTGTIGASLAGSQKVAVYDTVNLVATKLGYATIDATNPLKWTFTPSTALASGNHVLTADVENTASGSQGSMSTGFAITERPVTLHVADNVGALQGDVLAFGNGGVTDDTTVVLSGTIGTPLALGGFLNLLETVQVYDNGISKGAATVSGTDWNMTLANLSAGTHNFTVSINPLVGSPTVATAGSIKVQATDVLSITSDPSYSTTALAAKFTLPGSGSTLDLTKVSGAAQPHMDVIDVGATNGTVKLALADVLTGNANSFTNANGWSGIAGTGRSQIVVDGSVGTVTMTDGSWSNVGSATHAGHTYNGL